MHGRLRRIKTIAACGALRILGSTHRRPRHKDPASCVRLCGRLRRSGGDLRARGLVRGRRLVLSAAWAADSAHRDHPRQSPSHSRQARRVHRGAFSRRAPVEAKLNETDFASLFSDWLDDPTHSADSGRVMRNLLPEAIEAAESSGLKTFLARRAQRRAPIDRLEARSLRACCARSLATGASAAARRHHGRGARGIEQAPDYGGNTKKLRAELPTLLNFYRADAYLMKRAAASAALFFEDVRAARGRLDVGGDRSTGSFVDRTAGDGSSPAPSILFGASAGGEAPALQHRLAQLLREVGAQLSPPIPKCGPRSIEDASWRQADSSPSMRAECRHSKLADQVKS